MTLAIWIDGSLREPAEATVSAMDHGLTVGDGVFETLRLYRGVAFALRRHLDRLGRSAAGLGLAVPDRSLLERAVTEVATAGGRPEAYVRLTVTSGPGPPGSARPTGGPTVVAVAAPLTAFPPHADVAVVPWPRNERGALAGLKTTSYAENVVALAWARQGGAGEAIFANTAGRLCEGTGSNVFVAVDGALATPPLSAGALAGVTRELVMELVEVEETDLPLSALAGASEAFLTSSTREVQPIARVDGRALPGPPGPLTRSAQAAFGRLVAGGRLDP